MKAALCGAQTVHARGRLLLAQLTSSTKVRFLVLSRPFTGTLSTAFGRRANCDRLRRAEPMRLCCSFGNGHSWRTHAFSYLAFTAPSQGDP
jgi:hypothetical protein